MELPSGVNKLNATHLSRGLKLSETCVLRCGVLGAGSERRCSSRAKGNSGGVKGMEMDERAAGAGHEAFPYGTFAMADAFLRPNQTRGE